MKSRLSDKKWMYVATFFYVIGVFIASFKVYTPYSYWVDELWSVTAGSVSLKQIFDIMLHDVHPPLYQLILRLWMFVFGDSEFATRSLSWTAGISALVVMSIFLRAWGSVTFAAGVIFFASNPLFTFYANETRSYALLLLGTVITTWLFLKNDKDDSTFFGLLICCLILSLLHYFGLIFSLVVFLYLALENWKSGKRFLQLIVTGIVICVWPAYHALGGTVLEKTGGKFWIKVSGVLDTISIFASGYLPLDAFLPGSERISALILSVGLLAAAGLFVFSLLRLRIDYRDPRLSAGYKSLYLVVALLAITSVIDLVTPISTRRNYIVLLPAMTFLFASISDVVCRYFPKTENVVLCLVLGFGLGSSYASYSRLIFKSYPRQGWKEASRFMGEHSVGQTLYYASKDDEWGRERKLVNSYYLGKFSSGKLELLPFVPGATQISPKSLILYGHLGPEDFDALVFALEGKGHAERCTPVQSSTEGWGVGVFVVK